MSPTRTGGAGTACCWAGAGMACSNTRVLAHYSCESQKVHPPFDCKFRENEELCEFDAEAVHQTIAENK